MNKMKRLLALTICLLLAITSLPVTQLVFANDGLVVLHEDTFDSASDISWTYKEDGANYFGMSVDENGNYVITQVKTNGAEVVGGASTTFPSATRSLGEFIVESSDENRTEVVADGLNGKYTYEFDLEALVKTYESTSDPYFSYIFNSIDGKTLINVRLNGTSINIFEGSSINAAGVYRRNRAGNGVWQAHTDPQAAKFKFTLDTTTGAIEAYYNEALMDKYGGKDEGDDSLIAESLRKKPIGQVTFSTLSRMDVGSYLKLNDFKITQLSNAADATLSALPTKLVENVNGATETSVTLPSVSGVEWASADTSAATVSGNTLTLLPSTTGTKEAVVTATFAHNGANYVKTYKMTLAQGEEVIPDPTPTPTPTDGVVSVEKTFNYKTVDEALKDGWKKSEDNYSEIIVENGYPTYNQIAQCALYKADGSAYAANNGSGTKFMGYNLPKGVVAEDSANGTKIINETGKYMGKLRLEVDVEMDMKPAKAFYLTEDGTENGTPLKDGDKDIVTAGGKAIQVLQPQFNLTFAPNVAIYRMRPASQNYINYSSESKQTLESNKNTLDFTKGNTHKLVITVDTDADTTTGTIEGVPNVASGTTMLKEDKTTNPYTYPVIGTDYLLQLQLTGFERMEPGSKFTFKGVKLVTEEASYGTDGNIIVAQLPAKLGVADINNVTEATVTLPEIDGVTWTSVDESAATVDGNKVTFIPSTDGTKTVEIKASFVSDSTNDIKFSKIYTMTLAQGEEVIEPATAPGALVDSHSFSDSDVPGRRVYHAYDASTNFSGKYTADGFVLNRETQLTSGTGGKLSNEYMRINLTKKVGTEYEYGLKGKYAIDLTVNGKFSSSQKLSDVYLDGYMVSSGSPDSLTTSNDTNVKTRFIAEMGKTGNTFFQVSSASDSSLATERAPIPVDTDTVIRLIVDTVTGDVELYTSVDNKQTFESYGKLAGVYNGDSIQAFIFNPGLGLVPTSTMIFKNIDIYEISAEKDFVTVTYYVDGDVYETVSIEKGATTSVLSAPAKTGYIFEGWFEEDATTAFDFTKAVTGDVNLYAKYEAAPSNVVFMADGSTVATLTGKFGGVVEGTIPAIPAKTGYTAVGWYVGDTDEVFTAETPINSTNMIVKAKYVEGTLNVHTVTFKVDGATYATADAVDGYALLSVPENPEKENYTFAGWTLNGDLFDLSTPVTSSITLNAKFDPKEIKIKFFMDEALSESFMTCTGYYNTAYGQLPTPVKDTYTFLGWKNLDGTDFTADQILTKDISVYATWESLIKVVLDEDITSYGGLTGHNVEFSHSGAATALSYDNGAVMTWVTEMPTSRTFDNNLVAKFKIPLGEEDTVNRTQVYNNKLVGDYEVEVTMDVKLSDMSWNSSVTANPYGYYSTGMAAGSGFNNILVNRITSGSIQTFNNGASASSDFNATNTLGKPTSYSHSKTSSGTLADGGFESVVNRLRYDTTKNYAEMTAPGYTEKSYGSGMNNVKAINAVRYNMMACFAPGDYIRVKNIKVTQYNVDTTSSEYIGALNTIAQLPDSIVAEGDSPYNVTKNLVIPVVRGVTWSTSNKNAVDASTGEINKWYDPQEVIITASVNMGDYEFIKEYRLTIEGDKSIVKSTILDETFASEEDMSNWTFVSLADGTIADYTVDAKGVTISKVTAPEISDNTVEEKRYFAYYDLYTEAKADTYTTTSTKDVKGVYDVSINLGEYVATSTVPVNIGVGYRNGTTFYPYGSLVFDADGARFTYNYDTETVKEVVLGMVNPDSIFTIRVDNILGEIALLADGEILAREACSTGLGENAMINTVRTAIDVNNEMGDGVSIKGIKVEKVIANDIRELDDVISAADGLTINTVTSNPDAVSGTINALPATVGKYKVDWKSSSNQIDVETREVFHDATAKAVTITAEIYDANAAYPVVVRKSFNVTVRAASSDAELGQFEIAKLGRITNQNYNDIRYDLNLPVADNVTWTSSNTDIIGNDGKISDTVVLTEATPVKITATSKGVTKDYNLTVAPRTAQVNLSSGSLPLSIKLTNAENAKISSDVTAKFTYTHSVANTGKVNVLNDKGDILVSMVATGTGIYFDYKNSNYNEIALADGATANVEIIVMPDVDKVAVFVNDELAVDYADLKVATDYVASVDTTNAAISAGTVTLTVNKYGMLTANTDNFDYFADVRYGYAGTAGISLPTNIVSTGTVTWVSSNPSILGNDGSVGEVEKLSNVSLKFTITDNADSRIFITEDFEIVVDCNAEDNVLSGIVPTLSNLKDHSYPEANATDNNIKTATKLKNANKDDSEVVFNLGAEKSFNSMYISNVEGGIEDFEIYVSNDGSEWNEVYSGNFGDGKAAFVTFDVTSGKYIKLVVKQCDTKDVMIDEIKVFLSATKEELAVMDLEALTIPATAEGSKINLPATGINGTAFTWTTSDSDIIDTKGNVTRPSSSTTVTLTATVIVNGEPVSKEFDVFVDTKSTSGPTQVGGGAGGGGGGSASSGATSTPVIGGATDDTVYSENTNTEDNTTPSIPSASITYKDVKESDWYYKQVMTLTNEGIVSGDGTGYFNPTDNVTREQFVKMILEAIDVEAAGGEHEFEDVIKGAWYENYIATAVKFEIVNGISKTEFGIGSNITRQDMAVLIERVLKFKEVEIEKAEVEPFADADKVSSYAAGAVANMKAVGLIQGHNNMYNPKDNLTRAEAATVIASLLELLAK